MIEATERALRAGIAAARPGARIGDLSYAIGSVLGEAGYPVNTEFGGHGIGSTMHQEPHVPNMGRTGRGYKLRPGLLLALEPWVMADTAQLVTDPDGWTLRSVTGCRTAHSEHTIAITPDGAEILTLPTLAG
jgi:methionyl aminopeptidase